MPHTGQAHGIAFFPSGRRRSSSQRVDTQNIPPTAATIAAPIEIQTTIGVDTAPPQPDPRRHAPRISAMALACQDKTPLVYSMNAFYVLIGCIFYSLAEFLRGGLSIRV